MAELCSHPVTDQEAAERLFVFTRLQDTFECNGMCHSLSVVASPLVLLFSSLYSSLTYPAMDDTSTKATRRGHEL